MTTATIGYLKVQKEIQARISSIDIPQINWKAFCFAGLFLCLSLLIFYVWQINNLTHGSYLLNNYEKQISSLSAENKNLEVSFAESSFLGQALTKIQALNFQKVTFTSVKYLQILDSSAEASITQKKI